MAEYTGPLLDAPAAPTTPAAKPKPQINPALVNALTPPGAMPVQASPSTVPANVSPVGQMSPKDQAAFNLAQKNRLAAEALKREEEQRKEANPISSLTEGERKAGTLLQRMQSSSKQLQDVLAKYPDAAKPEYLSSLVQGFSEPAANLIRSTPRQQIETAQKDIVDAALTASTGASYTAQQFKEFREFLFPQIGDDLPTIKDKQKRLETAIESVRLQSGRAAKLVPDVKTGNNPPAGAPADVKQAKDGKWYSPDPARKGKYLQWGD
jgi:hypothetical protein